MGEIHDVVDLGKLDFAQIGSHIRVRDFQSPARGVGLQGSRCGVPESHVAHAHFDYEPGGGGEVKSDQSGLRGGGFGGSEVLCPRAADDAAIRQDLEVFESAAGAAVFLQTRPGVDEGRDFTGVERGIEIELRHLTYSDRGGF